MKLLLEDKTGLRIVKSGISIFIFFVFIFGSNIDAQITVKDFCATKNYSTPTGFNQFRLINLGNDSSKGLFIFNSNQKKISLLYSEQDSLLNKNIKKFFFFPVSDFGYFNNISKLGRFYIFVSNKSRVAGLTSFNKSKSLMLINSLSFDSYPSKIAIADINNDGMNEGLVFGNNFNGLSLLKQNNYKLEENHFYKNKIFSDAVFADFDYNYFLDIAAIDLISNSILFFRNDENGTFKLEREIQVDNNLNGLKAIDFNKDGFVDLMFSQPNVIKIFLGDSVSSFSKNIEIPVSGNVDKFVVNDFNDDMKNDVAYIDKQENNLFILLSGKKDSYNSILIKHLNGLTDLMPGYKNDSKLLALNREGFVTGFEKFKLEENVSLSLGGSPALLTLFDFNKDGLKDLVFLDEYKNYLKILISSKNKLLQKLYEFKLVENQNRFSIASTSKNNFNFFIYSNRGRLIEILKFNLKQNVTKKDAIYTSAPIVDLLALKTGLQILENKSDTLISERFDISKNQFNLSQTLVIDTNYYEASFSGRRNGIVYWAKADSELVLKNYNFKSKKIKILTKMNLVVRNNADSNFVVTKSFLNKYGNENVVSFVKENNNYSILISSRRKVFKTYSNENLNRFLLKDKNDINIYTDLKKRKEHIYIYDHNSKSVFQVQLKNKGNYFNLMPILNEQNMTSYTITNYSGNNYIIYNDTLRNEINLKRLHD